MRTTLDIVDILYQAIKASSLKTAISGGVYKHRPVNSGKEDVIINSLPVTGDQLQEGFANVNIHVPNLMLSIGGLQDRTQPDSVRLKALAALAVDTLKNLLAESGDVSFTITNQTVFEEPDIFENYVNIRLKYYAVNV